jgi:ferredoxin
MMKIKVNTDLCTGCGTCVNACPSGAMDLNDGLAVVIEELKK